jgi:hypothetical protein
MKKILPFPEKKMKRQKRLQRAETRTAVISLSVASLLLGAVLLNDQLARSGKSSYLISDNSHGIQELNRAIASATPMNPFRDLEWEKQLADKLARNRAFPAGREPSSIGHSVTSIDQLRFGTLAGKYRLEDQTVESSVKIKQIDYVKSDDVSDRAVFVNPEMFLKDYGSLLAVPFTFFDWANPGQNDIREYRLMDSDKKVIGRAAFVFDDEGRFISLKVATEQNQ